MFTISCCLGAWLPIGPSPPSSTTTYNVRIKMTFQWWFIVNLAASNLLLPLLIHQQSFGHPCSCLRHLSATHSLITNHLVDRSQVLRELYVIFWDRRVIQINLKIWSALVWCGTIKNVYWGYLCWAATEAVWERLNRGDMKALLRLIFKSCFFCDRISRGATLPAKCHCLASVAWWTPSGTPTPWDSIFKEYQWQLVFW